jgi:hypothetical protein
VVYATFVQFLLLVLGRITFRISHDPDWPAVVSIKN